MQLAPRFGTVSTVSTVSSVSSVSCWCAMSSEDDLNTQSENLQLILNKTKIDFVPVQSSWKQN